MSQQMKAFLLFVIGMSVLWGPYIYGIWKDENMRGNNFWGKPKR